MAVYGFPYVSVSGDRKITAADEAKGHEMIIDSGVSTKTPDGFIVSKNAGSLILSVSTGYAVITGHRIINDSVATVAGLAGHATYPRIDIIALESNQNTGVLLSIIVYLAYRSAFSFIVAYHPLQGWVTKGVTISQGRLIYTFYYSLDLPSKSG